VFDVQRACQRFALPALGRGRRSRPTGKMLRRRKLLEMAADSPASGARFVGHGLEDSPTVVVNPHAHNKPSCIIQASQTPNIKNKTITKTCEQRMTNKNLNDLPRTKIIKLKPLPTLRAYRDYQKATACKTTSLKHLLKNHATFFANG